MIIIHYYSQHLYKLDKESLRNAIFQGIHSIKFISQKSKYLNDLGEMCGKMNLPNIIIRNFKKNKKTEKKEKRKIYVYKLIEYHHL